MDFSTCRTRAARTRCCPCAAHRTPQRRPRLRPFAVGVVHLDCSSSFRTHRGKSERGGVGGSESLVCASAWEGADGPRPHARRPLIAVDSTRLLFGLDVPPHLAPRCDWPLRAYRGAGPLAPALHLTCGAGRARAHTARWSSHRPARCCVGGGRVLHPTARGWMHAARRRGDLASFPTPSRAPSFPCACCSLP